MAEEKRKRQQLALMVGGAVAVAAMGYWYYSSQPADAEGSNFDSNEDGVTSSSKTEQITVDDSNYKKLDQSNSFDERKTLEEPEIPPMDNEPIDALEEASVEEKETDSKEAESSKNAVSQHEESPVIVEPTEEELEARKVAEEAKRRKEEEERVQMEKERAITAALRKYEGIAQRVAKYKSFRYKNGKLQIKVLRATNVDKKDMGKKDFSDVYVKMEVPKAKTMKTTVKKDAVNPVWNEQYVLDVRDALKDDVTLTVMDQDTATMDDTIGKVQLDIVDICGSQDSAIVNRGFEVKGSKTGCKLFVDLKYMEEAVGKK